MGVFLKPIVENEGMGLRKKEKSTEHIVSTDVLNDVWPSALVSDGNAEVVIAKAVILSQVRLGSRKDKQAGLPVMTNFIAL